jgi:hypothetical protein
MPQNPFGYSRGGVSCRVGVAGEGSRLGALGADGARATQYQYASPEMLALGIPPFNPYWDQATVPNGSTSVAVVFEEPRAHGEYMVQLSFGESPGSATTLHPTARTVNGFTVNVDVNPGADVDVNWLVYG